MTVIKLLSEDLIGKIAAGEVVERPASVVKELVENSIDAGTQEVSITIEAGGKKRIVVIDDACGMSSEDAKLSIQRHATSKISSDKDLNTISTLGFRGEALPSVAAVSKLTIETKSDLAKQVLRLQDSNNVAAELALPNIVGFKLVVAGGNVIESGDFGCPTGTKVCVDDLFFNTPARKKFLRGDKTEEGHVIDVVSRLALAFPEVRFKLSSDGKEKLSCLSVNERRARLLEVFGSKIIPPNPTLGEGGFVTEFEEIGNGIRIHGFLGSPDSAKRVAQGVYIFVNRRFIRDRLLNHAVVDGYRSLLPSGSYPFAIVMLDIDPERVDVNVHPTKQEVRFDNGGAIHNFVASAVRKAVQVGKSASQQVNRLEEKEIIPPNPPLKKGGEGGFSGSYTMTHVSETGQASDLSTYAPKHFNTLRVIGQLSDSYILCESEGGKLIVIDQHAAHERIGFEKLKSQLAGRKIECQQFLIPEQIELQAKEAVYISEHLETLNNLGIEIEPFGGKTFIIKSLPVLLADTNVKELILRLARELADIGGSSSVEQIAEHILKTMACHRQVRAGQRLKEDEMRALLCQMDEWPNTSHCPHGRPAFIEFSADKVAKWFKRG